MKIRVADYIANFLVDNNIDTLFSVVGGGAMHLNDAFGHKKGLKCIYNHHEQACAIAAEGFTRLNNELPVVCVTTGPGGTNAITGVLGAYLDSIPMLIISGQVKYDMTVKSTGLNLRQLGDQEFDITTTVKNLTKYSKMVINPIEIKFELEKAMYIAKNGRPGPCWIDVPLDVQGAIIETDDLLDFDPSKLEDYQELKGEPVTDSIISNVIERIKISERPIIYAGTAIRTSGAYDDFLDLVKKLNIPIVNAWNATDSIYYNHELCVGCGGSFGDRAANFAVQNSDLIISLGCRLSTRQVSFSYDTWAREAYKIMVDIDSQELIKPTLNIDMPIQSDVKEFIKKFNSYLDDKKPNQFNFDSWINICNCWKRRYPVVTDKNYNQKNKVNTYAFLDKLTSKLDEGEKIVTANGSACACIHAYKLKENQRLIVNSGAASMGYDLPAAIGACFANNKEQIICISGDGSIQMNIQELQTIVHHNLPIKIFIINNQGYQSIRITQRSFFEKPFVGIGYDSGDVSFPDMEKISHAYGIPFIRCENNNDLEYCINEALSNDSYYMCEIMVDTEQEFEPKSASKRLSNGEIISSPLEDLKPFLDRNELKDNMIIDLLPERND